MATVISEHDLISFQGLKVGSWCFLTFNEYVRISIESFILYCFKASCSFHRSLCNCQPVLPSN